MKSKLTMWAALLLVILMSGSCYKTGEVIFQPSCKPGEIDLPNNLYNLLYSIRYEFFHASFNYNGTDQKLTGATSSLTGKTNRRYTFEYDENNNLVKVKTFDISGSLQVPVIYINYHYPAGARNSISDKIEVQFFYLNNDGFSYSNESLLTYQYNTEFQLTSIWAGPQVRETYDYDAGGNCTKNTVYDVNSNISTWYEYNAYDDKINPARSDRALQVFLNIYSKNNPTDMKRMVSGLGGAGIPGTLSVNKGSYTYNNNGYPLTFKESFFAGYTCWN
jgi:hypothetical protein